MAKHMPVPCIIPPNCPFRWVKLETWHSLALSRICHTREGFGDQRWQHQDCKGGWLLVPLVGRPQGVVFHCTGLVYQGECFNDTRGLYYHTEHQNPELVGLHVLLQALCARG